MSKEQPEIVHLFASNLRQIRKEKGYSLRELSARCNSIDNADLSRYEHADINISIGKLKEIADALEIDHRELLRPPKA